MRIEIVYALPDRACSLELIMTAGATVADALAVAARSPTFAHVNLSTATVGIFGTVVLRESLLTAGDRLEIYRPLRADAKTERRARVVAARKRTGRHAQ